MTSIVCAPHAEIEALAGTAVITFRVDSGQPRDVSSAEREPTANFGPIFRRGVTFGESRLVL
jgi:hypothetical protein